MRWRSLTACLVVSALCSLSAQPARADVFYAVENQATGFLFFIYDSPSFITTPTTVPASQLLFLNPAGATTTGIVFTPSSTTHPGTSELDALTPTPTIAEEFRFYPQGTFTQFGVTPGDSNSFGYPVSVLNVTSYADYAVPEPNSLSVLAAGFLGMLVALLRRRLI